MTSGVSPSTWHMDWTYNGDTRMAVFTCGKHRIVTTELSFPTGHQFAQMFDERYKQGFEAGIQAAMRALQNVQLLGG